MKRHWLPRTLLLVVTITAAAAAWDAAAILSRPLWPWVAWMTP